MQLENGKFYRNDDGEKVGPVQRAANGIFGVVFKGVNWAYKPDGTLYGLPGHGMTLVEEWHDGPRLEAVERQKGFLDDMHLDDWRRGVDQWWEGRPR